MRSCTAYHVLAKDSDLHCGGGGAAGMQNIFIKISDRNCRPGGTRIRYARPPRTCETRVELQIYELLVGRLSTRDRTVPGVAVERGVFRRCNRERRFFCLLLKDVQHPTD